MPRRRVQLNAVQTLALGFAALILLGGVLLALPVSSRDGRSLPFLDALFTAASASCVTGLVLYDTCTQFTLFGQAVILLLIQVGGMGFMTVSILVAVLLHRRIGLRQRSILMDSVGALQMGGIVRLTRRAIRVTLTCEGAGAALLALWFCPRYGLGLGLWMSLFHAVSSFCNAGFDLLGTGASLTTIAGEPLPNIVLMALVICGGLGFLVWDDLLTHGRHVRRWRLHSKIVLFSTTLLFAGGAIAFYFLEKDHAFAGAGPGRRALMAAFQSVTCRTAGFNTAPLTTLSQSRHQTGGTLNVTQANWKEQISNERVRELYMEGFRLHDLKRWKMGFERKKQSYAMEEGSTLKIEGDDPRMVWPIPQHELDAPGSEILPNESNK